jgi:HAMP domain-containing protein
MPTTRTCPRQLRRGGDQGAGWPLAGAGARQRLVVRGHPDHPACLALGHLADPDPGFAGWYLLRRRPLKRIRAIQAQAELIVAGDLTHRLPLSARRDELDMLAAIVNAMLDRIERLMHEKSKACATTSPTTCAPR